MSEIPTVWQLSLAGTLSYFLTDFPLPSNYIVINYKFSLACVYCTCSYILVSSLSLMVHNFS